MSPDSGYFILFLSQRHEKLLECGDRFDNTPLHVAAMKGHIEIVEMLLEKTVDIDRKNEDEQTPLLVAAKEGRPRQVKYLSVDS